MSSKNKLTHYTEGLFTKELQEIADGLDQVNSAMNNGTLKKESKESLEKASKTIESIENNNSRFDEARKNSEKTVQHKHENPTPKQTQKQSLAQKQTAKKAQSQRRGMTNSYKPKPVLKPKKDDNNS